MAGFVNCLMERGEFWYAVRRAARGRRLGWTGASPLVKKDTLLCDRFGVHDSLVSPDR